MADLRTHRLTRSCRQRTRRGHLRLAAGDRRVRGNERAGVPPHVAAGRVVRFAFGSGRAPGTRALLWICRLGDRGAPRRLDSAPPRRTLTVMAMLDKLFEPNSAFQKNFFFLAKRFVP